MEESPKNSKFHIQLPLFLALALAIGIWLGATLTSSKPGGSKQVGSQKFREVLTYIQRDYVDEVETDALVEESIVDMLDKLDPHSLYIPPRDRELVSSRLEARFGGIGVEFDILHDTITVLRPLEGGPSLSQGIRMGDRIVKVDGEVVAGIGITDRGVFDKLRGASGSPVTLEILRPGEPTTLTFELKRGSIPQYSLEVAYMVTQEIGYIKITRFAETTYDEFKEALTSLKKQGMEKLILDLQDNPGGLMDMATDIVDEFLAGSKLILYTESKVDRYSNQTYAMRAGVFEESPVIVLINEGSASASEIVAGALQDHDRALIVGRRSYGKGLVQTPISLSDGSQLRLTISRYYTPSGRSIQKPYGTEDNPYDAEVLARYHSGEVFSADSVKFADSLAFETTHGRKVYGGGGIMPDHFVPLDTGKYTNYAGELLYRSHLNELMITYYTAHKEKLEAMTLKQYLQDFMVSDALCQQLVAIGEANGVAYVESEFKESKWLIKNRIKAYIARAVWNDEGFYPVLNQTDDILQKALSLFPEAQELASLQ